MQPPAPDVATEPQPLGLPRVACVLVNWNTWQDTAACLESLRLQDYPALDVLVVDNGSTDDSLEHLRAAHPWATFVDAGANIGFPRGCNLGAMHPLAASADFLWLLNNDTVAPPATTRTLVACAAANPTAGLIGALLYFLSDPTRVQAWGGGRVDLWTGYNTHFFAPASFMPRTTYLTFASALIRREVYDALGGLFEGAFMYFEDADFCLRARAAGWGIVIAERTAILHREGASSNPRSPGVVRFVTAAGLLFLGRHAPVPLVACTLFLTTRLGKRLLFLDWPGLRAVWQGMRDGFKLLRAR